MEGQIEVNKNSLMKGKAIAYIRLSKDDSDNPSLSPANQKAICEDIAKKKEDTIARVYQDINRTGSNDEREGLEELREDAKKRLFSKLYLKDWSRLARNIVIQETIIKELSDLGIEIISCDGIEDKKARQVTGLTNEWFIDECRKKQQQIHKLKLAEQIPCSRPPYGYRMSKKLKRFVIEEEEAQDVKKIFQLRKEGLSISKISKEMKMPVSKIFNILKNRVYLGEIRYAQQWLPGSHESIITKEVLESVKTQKKDL